MFQEIHISPRAVSPHNRQGSNNLERDAGEDQMVYQAGTGVCLLAGSFDLSRTNVYVTFFA